MVDYSYGVDWPELIFFRYLLLIGGVNSRDGCCSERLCQIGHPVLFKTERRSMVWWIEYLLVISFFVEGIDIASRSNKFIAIEKEKER